MLSKKVSLKIFSDGSAAVGWTKNYKLLSSIVISENDFKNKILKPIKSKKSDNVVHLTSFSSS